MDRLVSWQRGLLVGAVLAALTIAGPSGALAPELGSSDIDRLFAGQAVVREDVIETSQGRYIGGVTYLVVNAPAAAVTDALGNVRAYRHMLPYTREVRWIGLSRRGEMVVELDQGLAFAHGHYAIRVRHEDEGGGASTFRFWLDRRHSHDIADANGFFHVESTGDGRTLLTYMVLVDLGPGWIRRLFEGRIRRVLLGTPMLVKGYVEATLRRSAPGS
jgi:hypothetical protein